MATKKTKTEKTEPKVPRKSDIVRGIIAKWKKNQVFSKRDISQAALETHGVVVTPAEITSVLGLLGDTVVTAEAPKGFQGNKRTAFFKRVGVVAA